MTRVGVTGHTNLGPATAALVGDGIARYLATVDPPLTGVTCLAPGADQIFAGAVLAVGGRVEVVLPAADYRESKVAPEQRPRFDELLRRAAQVRTMPFTEAGRAAYRAANEAVLETAEVMVAVWDGEASASGGTGDAVARARARNIPVVVVWPPGARRG